MLLAQSFNVENFHVVSLRHRAPRHVDGLDAVSVPPVLRSGVAIHHVPRLPKVLDAASLSLSRERPEPEHLLRRRHEGRAVFHITSQPSVVGHVVPARLFLARFLENASVVQTFQLGFEVHVLFSSLTRTGQLLLPLLFPSVKSLVSCIRFRVKILVVHERLVPQGRQDPKVGLNHNLLQPQRREPLPYLVHELLSRCEDISAGKTPRGRRRMIPAKRALRAPAGSRCATRRTNVYKAAWGRGRNHF